MKDKTNAEIYLSTEPTGGSTRWFKYFGTIYKKKGNIATAG